MPCSASEPVLRAGGSREIAQEVWCLKSQHHKLSPSDCCDCISGFYPLGYFQRCHQTKPLPRVSAPLLLERAAVRPHPLWAVLQRRVWSKGRVRKALVGGGRGKLDGAAPFRGMIGSELCVQCGEREREKGAEEQKEWAFMLCFVPPPTPPCFGFLESIRPPSTRTSVCGYSSCYLLLAVLVHVGSPNPVI